MDISKLPTKSGEQKFQETIQPDIPDPFVVTFTISQIDEEIKQLQARIDELNKKKGLAEKL